MTFLFHAVLTVLRLGYLMTRDVVPQPPSREDRDRATLRREAKALHHRRVGS